jgi:hypothetical protein
LTYLRKSVSVTCMNVALQQFAVDCTFSHTTEPFYYFITTSLLPLNKGCFLLLERYFVLSVWRRIHTKTSSSKQQVIKNQQHLILYPLYTHMEEIKTVDSLSTCQWMKWLLYLAQCRKCRIEIWDVKCLWVWSFHFNN